MLPTQDVPAYLLFTSWNLLSFFGSPCQERLLPLLPPTTSATINLDLWCKVPPQVRKEAAFKITAIGMKRM